MPEKRDKTFVLPLCKLHPRMKFYPLTLSMVVGVSMLSFFAACPENVRTPLAPSASKPGNYPGTPEGGLRVLHSALNLRNNPLTKAKSWPNKRKNYGSSNLLLVTQDSHSHHSKNLANVSQILTSSCWSNMFRSVNNCSYPSWGDPILDRGSEPTITIERKNS